MNKALIGIATAAMSASGFAGNFAADAVGAAPAGWTCGVTGRGQPHWVVAADPQAPSGSGKVLQQDGSGTFPWCIRSGTSMANGFMQAYLDTGQLPRLRRVK